MFFDWRHRNNNGYVEVLVEVGPVYKGYGVKYMRNIMNMALRGKHVYKKYVLLKVERGWML